MFPRIQFSDFLRNASVIYSQLSGRLGKVTWARRGATWPSGLLKLYLSTDGLKSALGSISWDGTPTITADGVVAGHGPDMGAVNRASRKVCVVRFKATKADDGITGDEHVFGPLYLRNGNLVGKIDGQECLLAASWGVGDEIAAVVEMTPSGVSVQLVGGLE